MLPPISYLEWALARYGQIDFDLGQSGVFPLPVDVLGLPQESFAGATDPTIVRRFRHTIGQRFDVPYEHALPAMGTTHGLWCLYASILSPGDDVVVESPVYEPLVRLAEGQGARVIPFVRDPAIDVARVRAAITPKTKLVVISNLHNPTGAYVEDGVIRELAKAVAPIPLLVDEVYRDLVEPDGKRGVTSFHLAENIVVTSSLTKVYGLGWLRAGWVLARKPIAEAVHTAILHSVGAHSWALASASQTALEKIEELHARSRLIRAHDEEGAQKLSQWVAQRPYLSFQAHRGSIFGFVTDTRGHNTRPWIERAIADQRVIVAPGEFFGAPSGFRIRYGAVDHAILDEGLLRLGRVLDGMP
jgi:aspartate/methionine/tyrosine aminotransferase